MLRDGDRTLAASSFEKRYNTELTVTLGEVLDVIKVHINEQTAWCSNSQDQRGYVPLRYLQIPHEPTVITSDFSKDYYSNKYILSTSEDTPSTSEDTSVHVYDESTDDAREALCYKVQEQINAGPRGDLILKKGELVVQLPGERWSLTLVERCCRPGSRVYVSRTSLALATGMDAKPWFLGEISRDEAENILKSPQVPAGTFLIRESAKTNGYVISHSETGAGLDPSQRILRHRKITSDAYNHYTAWTGYTYKTIEELVEKHASIAGGNKLVYPYNKNNCLRMGEAGASSTSIEAGASSTSIALTATGGGIWEPRRHDQTWAPSAPQAEPEPVSVRAPSQSEGIEWNIRPDRVESMDKLGSGHYGVVWKARIIKLGTVVALKTLNPNTMELQDFMKEAEAMKDLRHPNLIRLLAVCSQPSNTFILLEFCANGSVQDYVKLHKSPGGQSVFQPNQKLNILRGVASGMRYLALLNYIHRDLAARNVLLGDDLTAKVSDFGLAKLMKQEAQQSTEDNMKKPWRWTAPEALLGKNNWSRKSDVWSFGIFAWEVYTNCSIPYQDTSYIMSSLKLVNYLENNGRLKQPQGCPPVVYVIMRSCWSINPSDRSTFDEIEQKLDGLVKR